MTDLQCPTATEYTQPPQDPLQRLLYIHTKQAKCNTLRYWIKLTKKTKTVLIAETVQQGKGARELINYFQVDQFSSKNQILPPKNYIKK